jgi:ABC-type sugar transport system ATPase subunit
MTARLSIRGLRKTYGAATALDTVDLDLGAGELMALLGPSGCGKTTLLRILAGLLDPDRGQVLLGGEDISRRHAWERDIGLVFQNYALFPHMDVRQNVGFGLEMRKIGGAEAERRIDEALDIVSMRDFARRRPAELSGGQQQRIALARAIAIKPRLLLLDEPLSNLDAVLRQTVRVELRELHDRTGLTTIMVTHDQAEALTMADRVALMNAGSVLQVDPPAVLYERPGSAFAAAFLGSPPANLLPVAPGSAGTALAGQPWAPQMPLAVMLAGLSGPARLALRPETLIPVAPETPGAIVGRLKTVEYTGAERLAHVALGRDGRGPVIVARTAAPLPAAGTVLGLATGTVAGLFDDATGARLGPNQKE